MAGERPLPGTREPATPLVAPGAGSASPPLPLQNVRVNDPAKDELGHTNSESSVTVRGSRIVVAFNDASENSAGYAVSTDGGATFSHRRVPVASDGYNAGGPVVATGPDGEVYYAMLVAAAGGQVSTVGVAKSTDGGLSFTEPADVAFPVTNIYDFQDKAWLAVDSGAASPRKGNVYVTWTDFLGTGEVAIAFTRSTDGGATFSVPAALSPVDAYGVQSSTMAVAPNGDLYVAWLDGHSSPAGIAIVKSTDGGLSFGSIRILATINPLNILTGGGGVKASSAPTLAVDGSGTVHLAYAAVSGGATLDRADVFYSRSTDSGASFSAPRKLNDDGTSTTQAFPTLAATADGHVAVRYLDRRADPLNDGLGDVSVIVSRDRGATWGKSRRVTDQSFSYGPVERLLGSGYHGDYDGLAADGDRFYVTWSDERGSDPDVYLAFLPVDTDGSAPDFGVTPLRLYGLVKAGQAISFDLGTSALNGFSGSLSLSASAITSSGAPAAGLTFSFGSPAVSAGQPATLTVETSSSAAPGGYVVRVAASSGGVTRATTLRLTVLAAARGLAVPANVTSTAGFTGGSTVRVDASGRLHVAYEDDTAAVLGEDVFYRRSTDGGRTFTSPLKLNAAGSAGIQSVLALGPSNRVHVAWAGQASGDSNARIWSVRSTDGGTTFSTPVAVSGGDQYAQHPAIAVDANGNVTLAWFDVSSSPPAIRVSRSADGANYGSVFTIDEGAAASITRPGLAYDSKGALYLVYTQQGQSATGAVSQVGMAVARDGKTFGKGVDVTDYQVVSSFGPDVAVGPGDAVFLTYYNRYVDASTGAVNREVGFRRSTDAGATFSAEKLVAPNSGQSYFPAIAVEADGSVDVAWEDGTGNEQSDILLSRSSDGGQNFSAPLNLSSTAGLSGSQANPLEELGGSGKVGLSLASGTLYVTWLDDTPTNPDLFLLAVPQAALANRAPLVSIPSPDGDVAVGEGEAVTFRGSASDPDGDALVLSWTFGDGTASDLAAPPEHYYPLPGTYVVTLKATDVWGASSSATRRVSVLPRALPARYVRLLVPVVLESPGLLGSRYTSELTLVSRAATPTDVSLRYTSSVGSGGGVALLRLAAGEMRTVPGVVDFLRRRNLAIPADGSGQVGTLLVTFEGVADALQVFAGARTETLDPAGSGGSFGLFYGPAAASSGPLVVPSLQQNASQRSNLALVNAGNESIGLSVALQGPNGEPLGSVDTALPPYGWTQINQPLLGKAASGRAVVTRTSGGSPFFAYAVLNDEVTSDGSFVPPESGGGVAGDVDRLVPVVVDVKGLGARFRTELTLANATSSPLGLTLTYTPAPGFGSGGGSFSLVLEPGEQRILPDALSFLRTSLPIEGDGQNVAGSLLVRAPVGLGADAFQVGARTYVPLESGGSFGLYYPGLTRNQSAEDVAWVYGLLEDAAHRSNLAIVNRGEALDILILRVQLYAADGTAVGEPDERPLGPGEWVQLNRPLAALGVAAGYARVERVLGRSRFVAYGVVNDNVTSDGSYVPMVK